MATKIIFVYNADSGMRNMVLDTIHKIVSPSTYECKLCDITYGTFTENKIWKKFRKETVLCMEFLHKDEFETKYALRYQLKFDYPLVLSNTNDNWKILINTEELNAMKSVQDLILMIKQKI